MPPVTALVRGGRSNIRFLPAEDLGTHVGEIPRAGCGQDRRAVFPIRLKDEMDLEGWNDEKK